MMRGCKEALVGHVLGREVVMDMAFSYVMRSLKNEPCQLEHTKHCSLFLTP